MDFLPPPNTPIVVMACRVFQNWLEHLLPEGLAESITRIDPAEYWSQVRDAG
jgi:hypothetical protein